MVKYFKTLGIITGTTIISMLFIGLFFSVMSFIKNDTSFMIKFINEIKDPAVIKTCIIGIPVVSWLFSNIDDYQGDGWGYED